MFVEAALSANNMDTALSTRRPLDAPPIVCIPWRFRTCTAVLAPLAVDQAAIRCSWRPRERRALSRAGFDERHKNTLSDTARCEDVAHGQSRAHQTSLHGWRPGFALKPQRSVRSDEVVVATHELDVAAELVRATGVAGRAPTQARRRLPNREVEALDERGVQGF